MSLVLAQPLPLLILLCFVSLGVCLPIHDAAQAILTDPQSPIHTKVLVLGGGVAGIAAAQALSDSGISDFIIVEAREELGGRMMSHSFGSTGKQYTVELGANWIQGTQVKGGSGNPIWTLGRKHSITTRISSVSNITTFDETGPVDFLNTVKASENHYARLTRVAGSRVSGALVDGTARAGYSLTGSQPSNRYEMASEYLQFDWEFAQSPEETSWIASSWANNYTFRSDAGGFSDVNEMSVDQRGFKTLIQAEASSFLKPDHSQLHLNSTVKVIKYSSHGVQVSLEDGTALRADYAICTFSLGVLQHNDVSFRPRLPEWKQEAIQSMSMGIFTKIFLQFPEKFWFGTEMGLYADRERGRYAVWQSLDHKNYLPGSGIIFVMVTGDFAKRVEVLPDDQVKSEVLSVLQAMYPNVTIPTPLDFYFQRWHSDPLFRGSYSNWPASFFIEQSINLRANIGERLWFAGEAASKKHFGFLHGAYFEGKDIGSTVAKCLQGGGCVGLEHVERVKNLRPYERLPDPVKVGARYPNFSSVG